MARPRALRSGRFTTARIWEFAGDDLAALQENLHAAGMPKASKDDIASALVWNARRMPGPVVKAMIELYISEESRAFLAAKTNDAPPA